MNKTYHQAEQWGRVEESLAARFLFFKGYRILKKRFKTPLGD